MDFITGLPKSKGNIVIMVVVDRLKNYAYFFSISRPFKENTVATSFMETIQKLHGFPKIIVSEKDPIFTGNFWIELFSCLGTQLSHNSSYHSQSDGKMEIVNKYIEGYLQCFPFDKHTQLFKWFPLAEWWCKTSSHTSSKMSPFLALYGYHPTSNTSPLKGDTKVQEVEDHIGDQQEVFKLLNEKLVVSQNRMKQQVDQHCSEREFEVGYWVYFRLQPYKQISLNKQKKDNKLAPKHYSPYNALKRI
jgi:hypothetical protein